jgi:hypothetical protein
MALIVLGFIGWLAEQHEQRRRRRAVLLDVATSPLPMFYPHRVGVERWAVIGRGSHRRYHYCRADAEEAVAVAAWLSQDAAAVQVEIRAIEEPGVGAESPVIYRAIVEALAQHRNARLALEG